MLPVCNLLLVLFNGCNTTSFLPQVTNNCTQALQLPSTGCICPCQSCPNILKLCDLSNATISPCAPTTTGVTETIVENELSSTTPRISTAPDDDEIFNDEGRKRKKTTNIPTTLKSSTASYPIFSTVKTTSLFIEDNQTPSPPDSSDQRKDKTTTQNINDVTEVHTTTISRTGSTMRASSSKPITQTTPTPDIYKSSTEKTIVTEKKPTSSFSTTSTSSKPSFRKTSTSKSPDDTTTPPEHLTSKHVSPSDQSSSSSSIYTTQPSISRRRTTKFIVSSSSTPQYEDSPSRISTSENPLTSTVYSSVINKGSTAIINSFSSTTKRDRTEEDRFSSTKKSVTTPSFDYRSSTGSSDSTYSSTGSKRRTRSTTTGYTTTIAPTSPTITHINTISTGNPKISTTEPSVSDDITTTSPQKFTLLPTVSTQEDETFNDESRKKTTTKIPTTFKSIESTTTPYPMSRSTTEQNDGSTGTVTTESITEVKSTTSSLNETDCDLTDQPQDKSIDPLNEAELISLRRTKRSLFEYGSELSKVLLKNDTSNVAVSPINFALLLAMVRTGCRSPMKEEFDKVLRISPNITENRLKIFKSIVDSLNNVTNIPNVKVNFANKMYLPEDVNISPKFEKLTKNIFQSKPQTIDFKNVNSAITQLNNWSANVTNYTIPTFIDTNSLDSSTSVLLSSVAYFSGNWSKPFERQFTSKNPFYVNESIMKSVCTMIQVNKFRYGQLPNLNAEFVELPFESHIDEALAMVLILPMNGTKLDTVAENLDKLKSPDFMKNSTVEVVQLSLPKFRIESVVDLAENPEEFGLSNITTYNSDFKCFCKKESLQISHIVQKTVIDVHEGGCKSINYICPQVEEKCRNSSIKFTVNKPFIVLIIDSDMILFSGRVNDPSL